MPGSAKVGAEYRKGGVMAIGHYPELLLLVLLILIALAIWAMLGVVRTFREHTRD